MIVTFHRRNPGADLPQRRVELYKEICRLQLKDRPNARRLETLLTQCEAQTILQQIALGMMEQHEERIKRPTLLRRLKEILKQQGESIEATEFLDQIVQVSELLVQQEDEYEFAHLSFQEYLAAVHIAQARQEHLLYPYFGDDKWKPTILLYAAQITNPTTVIQEAVNRGAINLAYQCLQELPKTKRIAPALEAKLTALKQTVQTSRYHKLEEHLKNGQWKEADEETYRLMITTVNKEEGQTFDNEDLLNFPCEELLVIDGLWVRYSNGKFGFSIQKDIYLKCGGIIDGKYQNEAFEKFCDVVEWRKEKVSIVESSAPLGQLPWYIWSPEIFQQWRADVGMLIGSVTRPATGAQEVEIRTESTRQDTPRSLINPTAIEPTTNREEDAEKSIQESILRKAWREIDQMRKMFAADENLLRCEEENDDNLIFVLEKKKKSRGRINYTELKEIFKSRLNEMEKRKKGQLFSCLASRIVNCSR